ARAASASTARIQSIVATLLVGGDSSSLLSTSAGVFQPSVLRGRLLSVSATALRWLWFQRAKSVPLGKYWRSKPLVFSLVPRCHGLCGSQKYTWSPVSIRSLACSAISAPWSQVSDRRSCSGRVVIVLAIASRTAPAPCPVSAGPFFTL